MDKAIARHARKEAKKPYAKALANGPQPERVIILSTKNLPVFDAERRARYEAAARTQGVRRDYPKIDLP